MCREEVVRLEGYLTEGAAAVSTATCPVVRVRGRERHQRRHFRTRRHNRPDSHRASLPIAQVID